jgi:sodium-dependent phosphate transporter
MIFGTIFEMLGAITVGSRTAETIKNGIIPNSAFQNNAGVQMLAFTCALAAASLWVMWCTRHSAHVSSTYSLISAVAGVGVATVGASKVQWGWNGGKGLGAIFAGLGMAPAISAGFGASIFMLIKVVVHMRKNPAKWAVYTSPFFFLIAGTICTMSIVYKGSPNLGLNKKPGWYVASVTMGTGGGVMLLAALFFVPYVYAKVLKRDYTIKSWMFIFGPALFKRTPPADALEPGKSIVPNYAVVQDEDETVPATNSLNGSEEGFESKAGTAVNTPVLSAQEEKDAKVADLEASRESYAALMAKGDDKLRQKLLKGRGPLGWAMRTLRDNPMGAGEIYELHNLKVILKRIPAMLVCAALYGLHYDIHAAQSGYAGTPEGRRMARTYALAEKYPNEVEHTYSFVQVLTACTASFAHGANDIGNSVGPWAVIYSAWSTGNAAASSATVPVWQLAVLSATISLGLLTYGYNIMKGKLPSPSLPFPSSLRSHSSRSFANKLSLSQSWATRSPTTPPRAAARWRWAPPSPSSSSRSTPSPCRHRCASRAPPSASASATAPSRPSTGTVSGCSCCRGSRPSRLRARSVVSSWGFSSTRRISLRFWSSDGLARFSLFDPIPGAGRGMVYSLTEGLMEWGRNDTITMGFL